MGRPARIVFAISCLAVTALVAGCGKSGTAIPGEIDVRTLDTGSYPVDRYTYDRNANGSGNALEGMRMAAAVVPSVKIDSSLDISFAALVMADSTDVINYGHLAAAAKPVLDNRGYLTGYAAGGSDRAQVNGNPDPNGTDVTVRVLRFSSADNAKLAARELEDADFNVALNVNQKLSLPDYPDAFSHWRPGVPNIGLAMPHKDFVISLFISRPTANQADLLSWAKKALDAEVPQLDAFGETPADQIAQLPVDPDRLLARTLVADRDHKTPDQDAFALYPANWLVLVADKMADRVQLVANTGLTEIAIADGNFVFRLRDAQAGKDFAAGMIKTLGENSSAALDKVPDTTCVHRDSDSAPSRCYVGYKQYVAVVDGTSVSDAQSKAAAQYALLANAL